MDPRELALWVAWEASRSDSDRNALVTFYLPIVVHLAKRLLSRLPADARLELQELVNDGVPALINRIETFDRSRNLQFHTWAHARVYGAMVDALRNFDWVPRLERRIQKSDPSHAVLRILPLATAGDDEYAIQHGQKLAFAVPGKRDAPCSMERADFWRVACKGLRRNERLVVLMRFREGMTMAEIGLALNLCEARISQMLKAILMHIRSRSDVLDIQDAA